MLRNYILVTLRNFRRNPMLSFINIFGLAIAMAASMVIIRFAYFNKSYDNFYPDADRIYVLGAYWQWNESGHQKSMNIPVFPYDALDRIKADNPKIEYASSYDWTKWIGDFNVRGGILELKTQQKELEIPVDNSAVVDPNFFDFFGLELSEGSSETILNGHLSAGISESLRKNLFGNMNPIGQLIEVNEAITFKVSGVFKDIPPNSIFANTDIAFSNQSFKDSWIKSGRWSQPFIKLKKGVDHKRFEDELRKNVDYYFARIFEEKKSINQYAEPMLWPVTKIWAESPFSGSGFEGGYTKSQLNILLGIGLFILIMAWFNYINLTLAKTISRLKELGVRKVSGASKKHIIQQFLVESLLYNISAFVIGITIIQIVGIFRPEVNIEWLNYELVAVLVISILTGSLLCSIYPALISSSKISSVFSNNKQSKLDGAKLRRALIVFQFACSFGLLIFINVISEQLDFVLTKDLGFNTENIISIKLPPSDDPNHSSKLTSFKNNLEKIHQVDKVALSYSLPAEAFWIQGGDRIRRTSSDASSEFFDTATNGGVSHEFVDLFDIEIIAGRNFQNSETEKNKILISERLLKRMGISDPNEAIGMKLDYYAADGSPTPYTSDNPAQVSVIGVIKEYEMYSLHSTAEIRGCLLTYGDHLTSRSARRCSAKLLPGNTAQTIQDIKLLFQDTFGTEDFSYFFQDDQLAKKYVVDFELKEIVTAYSIIAIIISCLGLFGLVSIMVIQRTKELGIRKVLGASISHLLKVIGGRYVKLVLIAGTVSIPFAYYFGSNYLNGYRYRIDMGFELLLIPFGFLLLLTLLIIASRVFYVAKLNPSDSLRYE